MKTTLRIRRDTNNNIRKFGIFNLTVEAGDRVCDVLGIPPLPLDEKNDEEEVHIVVNEYFPIYPDINEEESSFQIECQSHIKKYKQALIDCNVKFNVDDKQLKTLYVKR
jgi:hypothetical protein